MENKYWIIFGILLIGLILSVRKNNKYLEGFENISEEEANIENKKVKLTKLLGLLLDNQGFANQIIIDHSLTSVRDLVEKNRKKLNLNLKPILDNTQYRIVTRYLLLNDIYFTSGKTQIEQDETKVITFSRQTEFIKPKELYKSSDEEDNELNSFRKNYHLMKNMYLDYQWIKEKVNNYIKNYGVVMLKQSMDNMKEIFGNNYWEGTRFLNKSNLKDLKKNTMLYMIDTEQLFYKTNENDDIWVIFDINIDKNINLLIRIINNPDNNWDFWINLISNNKNETYSSNQLPTGEYFWVRSSGNYDIDRLYRKVDELSQNNYFAINTIYDTIIKLPSNQEPVYTQIERMNLFKKWIESKFENLEERIMFVENIIIDLNQRIINIFDDICSYLIFYQQEDFSEIYLDKYLRLDAKLNYWWSDDTFENVLIKGTSLGQCVLPASFNISKIQNTPPLYKFVYNRNLYNTFWQPLEIYINDLENYIINKFKNKTVSEIAPIARFCIFNNPQLRNYLNKYAACTNDSCELDLSKMKEPDRCGALKLKYQELMNMRMKYKCFYRSKTDMNSNINKKNIGIDTGYGDDRDTEKMTIENENNKVDQMFGFANVLLLNIIEFSLKLHNCQTERIEIKDCQNLLDTIDTNDQKDDLKLGAIIVDRKSDLYSTYDNQLNDYNKILQKQEIKKLEPLNQMANLEESKKMENNKKNGVDIMSKSADDFYSIINDLTNLSAGNYSSNQSRIEEFDNSIKENLDLSYNEHSLGEYQARLEREIRGSNKPGDNQDWFHTFKDYFYQIFSILTKDGRIMTSGMLFIIVAFGLYFIDISS